MQPDVNIPADQGVYEFFVKFIIGLYTLPYARLPTFIHTRSRLYFRYL